MIIDKNWQAVKVQFYCAYKGEETPRSFQIGGKRYKIKRVLEEWYEGKKEDNIAMKRVFRVVIEKGGYYILAYDNLTDEWYVRAAHDFEKGTAGGG